MADKVIVTKTKLDALATSISEKSGVATPMTIAQMKAAVDGISSSVIIKDEPNTTGTTGKITGGSSLLGSKTVSMAGTYDPSEDGLDGYSEIHVKVPKESDEVCFWDYEGTLLYSCSMVEAKRMSAMPEFPDHSNNIVPLTPLCWNWTLDQLHSIEYPADIGAIYYPTDGKTHFFIELDEKTGLEFTVRQYNASTIDWGDGNEETTTATGSFSHTYAQYGKYHLKVGNTLVASTGNDDIFTPKEAVVDTIYFGKDIANSWIAVWNANLFKDTRIEYAVIPYGPTPPTGTNFLSSTRFLKHINLNYFNNGHTFLSHAYALRHVSLPYTDDTLNCSGTYEFYVAPALTRLRLQGNVSGGRGTFTNCFSLEEIGGSGYLSNTGALSSYDNLYALKKFTIHPDCTAVNGDKFLNNAYSLEDLYVYPTTPPTLQYASINTHSFLRIHVPASSLTAYKEATNWSTYADYMIGDL